MQVEPSMSGTVEAYFTEFVFINELREGVFLDIEHEAFLYFIVRARYKNKLIYEGLLLGMF